MGVTAPAFSGWHLFQQTDHDCVCATFTHNYIYLLLSQLLSVLYLLVACWMCQYQPVLCNKSVVDINHFVNMCSLKLLMDNNKQNIFDVVYKASTST